MTEIFDRFEPPQFTQIPLIRKIYSEFPPWFCEYSIANIFIWSELFATKIAFHSNRLFIYSSLNDVFLFPAGKPLNREEFFQFAKTIEKQKYSGNIGLVPEELINQLPDLNYFYKIFEDRKNADYIYLSSELAELRGNRFHAKKNLLNHFLQNNRDHQVDLLRGEDFLQCLQLSEIWCKQRDCMRESFFFELQALQKAFLVFRELQLEGLKITIKGEIVAFTIFSELNSLCADIHFEKFNPKIKGVAQMINHQTAHFLQKRYRYINREQDLGLEGLRRAKLSYHPRQILIPYFLKRVAEKEFLR